MSTYPLGTGRGYLGIRGARFGNHCTRCTWVVSFILRPLSPWEKNLRDELHRRLVGPHNLPGSLGEEENLLTGREWKALARSSGPLSSCYIDDAISALLLLYLICTMPDMTCYVESGKTQLRGKYLHLWGSLLQLRSLTLRRLTSYIYGAPILDVSRSHTTTQHSR